MLEDKVTLGPKHFVIPDTQVRDDVPLDHLTWCGLYLCDKRPDVVVMLGDFADMPSLSSYDKKGSKHFENRRYQKDIDAARRGMSMLLTPLRALQEVQRRTKHKVYEPRLVMLYGNHEDRIPRAVNDDPSVNEGRMSLEDLGYEEFGWEVVPFLQPINIDGVVYSHYFSNGIMGRPITRAAQLLTKLHMSCIAGHQQGRDIAYGKRADGRSITGLIAGSFYQHEEDYLNIQTNNHWRGVYVLHEVRDGEFDEMAVSMAYLKKRYAGLDTPQKPRLELGPLPSSEADDERHYGKRERKAQPERRTPPEGAALPTDKESRRHRRVRDRSASSERAPVGAARRSKRREVR